MFVFYELPPPIFLVTPVHLVIKTYSDSDSDSDSTFLAILPGAHRCEVSAWTGWSRVSTFQCVRKRAWPAISASVWKREWLTEQIHR